MHMKKLSFWVIIHSDKHKQNNDIYLIKSFACHCTKYCPAFISMRQALKKNAG